MSYKVKKKIGDYIYVLFVAALALISFFPLQIIAAKTKRCKRRNKHINCCCYYCNKKCISKIADKSDILKDHFIIVQRKYLRQYADWS